MMILVKGTDRGIPILRIGTRDLFEVLEEA
jgi:hypothetical protein